MSNAFNAKAAYMAALLKQTGELESSPEAFLRSPAYERELQAMITGQTESLGRIPTVHLLFHQGVPEETAWTDGNDVFVNTGHCLVLQNDSQWKMHLAAVGFATHEAGHDLFTDFVVLNKLRGNWMQGRVFMEPCVSRERIGELMDALKIPGFAEELSCMVNAIEDVYIERRIREWFGGVSVAGLNYLRDKMYEQASPTDSLFRAVQKGKITPARIVSIVLQTRALGYPMKNWDSAKGMYLFDDVCAAVKEAEPFVRVLKDEQNGFERCKLFNLVAIVLAQLTLACANLTPPEQSDPNDGQQDQDSEPQERRSGNGADKNSCDRSGSSDSSDGASGSESSESQSDGSDSSNGASGSESGESQSDSSTGESDSEDEKSDESQDNASGKEDGAGQDDGENSGEGGNGSPAEAEKNGKDSENAGDSSAGDSSNADENIRDMSTPQPKGYSAPVQTASRKKRPDREQKEAQKEEQAISETKSGEIQKQLMKELIEKMAEQSAEDAAERAASQDEQERRVQQMQNTVAAIAAELQESDQKKADISEFEKLASGDTCGVKIYRPEKGNPQEYREILEPVLSIARPAINQVRRALKNREEEGWTSGWITGKRFDIQAERKNDFHAFRRYKEPDGDPDLVALILLDLSGSMETVSMKQNSGSKVSMARQAAVLIDFILSEVGVSHAICGHHVQYGAEDEYVEFVDFNRYNGGSDKYRLINMPTGGCNADGEAIGISCEKLLERKEKTKLLIVISDGCPTYMGPNYGMLKERTCNEDAKEAVAYFRRKDVKIIAVGIDKACVKDQESIYGANCVLDCTELTNLGPSLTRLLKSYILKG